ncbi:MPT63 family protein [Mycolicibacterium pulveris]|uniref:MPT63 family protein n=1 Tax=Mycolicibacterium pulveris TaxID=36813 RepID=UPI003CED8825
MPKFDDQECITLNKMSKITISATASFAAAGVIGVLAAPVAGADPEAEATTQTQVQPQIQVQTLTLGTQGKLVDGNVVQGWTVDNLQPSSDPIPYNVVGTLWEVTANDQAIQGTVIPIVSNLNARASDGQTYRALFGVATPQGVNPAALPQGEQTTGKVYFDVTGAEPNSIVYNAAGQDLIVWVKAPESTSSGATSTSYPSNTSQSPAQTAPAPEATAAEPAAAPEGSQGTPLPEGTQPVPAGSAGTPLPPAEGAPAAPPAEGAPAPAAEGTPQPAGSQGTPAPAGDQAPTPTVYAPAP